jgi:hypothetical protein
VIINPFCEELTLFLQGVAKIRRITIPTKFFALFSSYSDDGLFTKASSQPPFFRSNAHWQWVIHKERANMNITSFFKNCCPIDYLLNKNGRILP